jgi:hypothetical protein
MWQWISAGMGPCCSFRYHKSCQSPSRCLCPSLSQITDGFLVLPSLESSSSPQTLSANIPIPAAIQGTPDDYVSLLDIYLLSSAFVCFLESSWASQHFSNGSTIPLTPQGLFDCSYIHSAWISSELQSSTPMSWAIEHHPVLETVDIYILLPWHLPFFHGQNCAVICPDHILSHAKKHFTDLLQ